MIKNVCEVNVYNVNVTLYPLNKTFLPKIRYKQFQQKTNIAEIVEKGVYEFIFVKFLYPPKMSKSAYKQRDNNENANFRTLLNLM